MGKTNKGIFNYREAVQSTVVKKTLKDGTNGRDNGSNQPTTVSGVDWAVVYE